VPLGVIAQPPVFAIEPALPVVLAVIGFVNETTWEELIVMALDPLVWIAIAPEVSVVIASDVPVVVPALSIVAILGSRCRS
jgi:hypothetical protein